MAAAKKGGLGKGLDALFQDNSLEGVGSTVTLRLSDIEPNKEQPRKHFDQEKLANLAESIREHGVLQPIIVRPMTNEGYQIIAGERRFRAAMMAGLSEVSVIIKDLSDTQTMEIALIENLQREDLNAIEEAEGYTVLMQQYGMTQDETSKRVGKSRSSIANAVRLLQLPLSVIASVKKGEISKGHARTLLAFEDDETILYVANQIISKGMSVREIERLAATSKRKNQSNTSKKETTQDLMGSDSWYKEMELALQQTWGRRVKINPCGQSEQEKGTITIDFLSKQDLTEMAQKLTSEKSSTFSDKAFKEKHL